jgi:tetratricopeptide (TPR) repeat protein
VIELRPEHPAGYAIRAWARSELGDAAGALEDVQHILQPLPKNARAWDAYFVRCLALAKIGRVDEAEADCKQALKLNPGHIVSLDQLALIALTRGSIETDKAKADAYYQEGIDYTTQILKVKKENAIAWANRGEAYSNLGNYEQAEADLTTAIELDPTYARAFIERGYARVFLDKPADALADEGQAVAIYQQDPKAFEERGQEVAVLYATRLFVTLYAGEYQTAVQDATTLVDQGSETPWVLSMRGQAHLELGELDAGVADLNRALVLDPEFTLALARRGYGAFLQGDLDRAQIDLDDAATRVATLGEQEEAELHYHRALLYQARQQLAQAQSEVTAAINLVQVPSARRAMEALQVALGG